MQGRIWATLCAAVAVAAAGSSAAQPAERPRPEDGYFQEVTRVADGVWLLYQPKFHVQPIGNVTVIEQADGLVLVDAGGSPGAGRRIIETVRKLSHKPVKAVIITHWHGDHPQGLSEIIRAWPKARTIATAQTQAHLREPATMNTPGAPDPAADAAFQKQVEGALAYMRRMIAQAQSDEERAHWAASERLFHQYGSDMEGALTLSTAEAFTDRILLPDRLNPVEALYLGRANTDGDAVVWLPRRKVLVAGDIVVAPIPFGFGSYPADWIVTLKKLAGFDFEVLVPGHGPPQKDRAYLQRLEDAIADILGQVAPLAAQGLSLDEVRSRVDASAQARGFVGDDPWLRRWFQAYWVAPLVASAYHEARGEPIVQSLKG